LAIGQLARRESGRRKTNTTATGYRKRWVSVPRMLSQCNGRIHARRWPMLSRCASIRAGLPFPSHMRLNKYISDTGLCSRREADEMIESGRVTVDGVKASVGAVMEADSEVLIDGSPLRLKNQRGGAKSVYIALNKPIGVTCTTEKDIKGNIVDFVDHRERIFPIGRLDKDSEGLILLTNNGDIVNEILRSENRHEKEYLVAVNKPITDEFVVAMSRGVRIHNQMTKPCKVYKMGKFGFRIILTQGLNRQIRLMAAAFGYRVKQLVRVRIVNIRLGNLKVGQWRNLTPAELKGLLPQRTEW
jgi:23S rRNA pseudouridine2604 synthase